MGKAVLAALGAAIAMFAWTYVSWTVLHLHDVGGLEKTGSVTAALREGGDETGVYAIPRPPRNDSENEAKRFKESHEEGPCALVFYTKEGSDPRSPMKFAKGFGVLFLTCLVLAAALGAAGIGNYVGRVLLCAAFGLAAAVHADGGMWAVFSSPSGGAVMQGLDRVVSFAVAGLVLAAVIKPRTE